MERFSLSANPLPDRRRLVRDWSNGVSTSFWNSLNAGVPVPTEEPAPIGGFGAVVFDLLADLVGGGATASGSGLLAHASARLFLSSTDMCSDSLAARACAVVLLKPWVILSSSAGVSFSRFLRSL